MTNLYEHLSTEHLPRVGDPCGACGRTLNFDGECRVCDGTMIRTVGVGVLCVLVQATRCRYLELCAQLRSDRGLYAAAATSALVKQHAARRVRANAQEAQHLWDALTAAYTDPAMHMTLGAGPLPDHEPVAAEHGKGGDR